MLSGFWEPQQKEEQEFLISVSTAEVTISGKTNVNRFVCSMQLDHPGDTLIISSAYAADTLQFSGLFLKFPIEAFDCGLKVMNHDFQEFLKADVYPELLLSINQMVIQRKQSMMEKVSVESNVNISLCGQKRRYDIAQGYIMELPDNITNLACSEVLRFTDFAMVPPTKFFGTIKVEDELSISLDIKLKIDPV